MSTFIEYEKKIVWVEINRENQASLYVCKLGQETKNHFLEYIAEGKAWTARPVTSF